VAANGIERLNPFAAPEAFENRKFLVMPIFGDDRPIGMPTASAAV
jgi:hypothetical protein